MQGVDATGACVIAGLEVAVASGLVGTTTVGTGGTGFGRVAGMAPGGLTGGALTGVGALRTVTVGEAIGSDSAATGDGFIEEETVLLVAGIGAGTRTTFGMGGKGISGVLVCERGTGVGGAAIPLTKMG